jgi:L-malate glycosyltransferase
LKHIVYILPYLGKAGTEKHVLSLAESWQQKYYISLLSPAGEGSKWFDKLPVAYYSFTGWDVNFFRGWRELVDGLKTINRDRTIDLIHVHASHELMVPCRWTLPKVPIVFTCHTYHEPSNYRIAKFFVDRFADAAIAVSTADFKLLSGKSNSGKVTLIYNGVSAIARDPETVAAMKAKIFGNERDIVTIGTAARLESVKGIDYLLKALAIVAVTHPQVRLAVAGTGGLAEFLQQSIRELGIEYRANLVGYVEDVESFIAALDIFVLPSLWEGLSLVIAEAMAREKPIIATDVGGTAEQIIDGETGLLVSPKNAEEIAKKIISIVETPAMATTLAAAAKARYEALFSLDAMLANTAEVYDRFL